MTKKVRIENADTADYAVKVELFEHMGDEAPPRLVDTKVLTLPAEMTEMYLNPHRYIKVSETSAFQKD